MKISDLVKKLDEVNTTFRAGIDSINGIKKQVVLFIEPEDEDE